MATSRSRGDTSLTIRSPNLSVPAVISSSPATIRRAVVLPHPDGPTSTTNSPSGRCLAAPGRPDQHHELAVVYVQVEGVHSLDAVRIYLCQAFERHGGHEPCLPSSRCCPAAGRSASTAAG